MAKRNCSKLHVTLPNGEKRIVLKSPDYETRDGFIYSPQKKNEEAGYGVCFETLDSAITWMFQRDCKHNIVKNRAKPSNPNVTPYPYKCTICNEHFCGLPS